MCLFSCFLLVVAILDHFYIRSRSWPLGSFCNGIGLNWWTEWARYNLHVSIFAFQKLMIWNDWESSHIIQNIPFYGQKFSLKYKYLCAKYFAKFPFKSFCYMNTNRQCNSNTTENFTLVHLILELIYWQVVLEQFARSIWQNNQCDDRYPFCFFSLLDYLAKRGKTCSYNGKDFNDGETTELYGVKCYCGQKVCKFLLLIAMWCLVHAKVMSRSQGKIALSPKEPFGI